MMAASVARFWSGNLCQVAGAYESDCPCAQVIPLHEGEDFPTCAECLQMVSWELLARASADRTRLRH